MVVVTRSKCALERHACDENNNFREKYLPDVTVPAEAIQRDESSVTTIGHLSSIMESIIRGVQDSPLRHRCVMVGEYPTFLLGKTDKFSGVDFLFVHRPQADNVSFFIQFANVLACHLNPDKKWFFEACFKPEDDDNKYSIEIRDMHLRDNIHMMLVTKVRNQGYASRKTTMNINTLKLSLEGIHVANFCFVGLSRGKTRLTVNGETLIDSIVCVENNDIVIGVINQVCNSYFVMAAAYFEGHGDTRLYCVDLSFKRLVDQVDNKYAPVFSPRNERKAKKHEFRASTCFKKYIRTQRMLIR